MRTPSQLMELFVYYESKNNFDDFVKSLCYEEVTMLMMVIELEIKNPSLSSIAVEKGQRFLEFFRGVKKQHLERN